MISKRRYFFLINRLLLAGCLFFSLQAFSQCSSKTDCQYFDLAVKNILNSHRHPYFSKNYPLPLWQAVNDLYFLAPESLLWLNRNNSVERVNSALKMLEVADASGLIPDDYNFPILKTNWATLLAGSRINRADLALFDTALSFSVLSYLVDLHNGRINPQTVDFAFPENRHYDRLINLLLNTLGVTH